MRPADSRPSFADSPAPHLSAAVLRQYAAGTLAPPEQRRVEAHTLDCALCADALDGYLAAPAEATAPAALAGLQQRLHQRLAEVEQPKPATAIWWRAAAAVLVLLVAFGAVRWWLGQPPQPAEVAAVRPAPAPPAAAEPAPVAPPPVAAETAPPPANSPVAAASAPSAAAPARRARPPRRAARPRVTRPDYAVVESGSGMAAAQEPELKEEMLTDAANRTTMADAATLPGRAVDSSQLQTDYRRAVVAAAPAKPKTKAKGVPPAAPATADTAADKKEAASGFASPRAKLPPPPPVAPLPTGGYQSYRAYLRRELQYPDAARIDRAEGIVKLEFTVEADGAVSNMKVVQRVHPDIDEEALRLVCEGPAWYPGIVNGRRAARTVELSIPFRLSEH